LVNNERQTTAVFAALADPIRRRILVRLSKGGSETPVTTLAKPFRVSPPAISRHLRILEKAKLIDRRREGRIHFIRSRPDGFKQAKQWITECAAGWNFSFDALDILLQKEQRKEKKQL
jgi:DNA-binding transcriptional ArsR family regulator